MSYNHGYTGTPTYCSWYNMKTRVRRGYAPLDDLRWNDFRQFLEDMGERPEGMTLDRINNAAGYGPDNCRWADHVTQQNNRTNNKLCPEDTGRMRDLAACGVSQRAIAKHFGVSQTTVYDRLSRRKKLV